MDKSATRTLMTAAALAALADTGVGIHDIKPIASRTGPLRGVKDSIQFDRWRRYLKLACRHWVLVASPRTEAAPTEAHCSRCL